MLSLEAAQEQLLRNAAPLATEHVPLLEALDRFLAADIVSRRTHPPAAVSAMDGYAIRFDDLPGPWTVTGESAAGRRHDGALAPGEAVRIFTGAVVPEGADTVIVQEDVARDGNRLTMTGDGPPRRGAHIRMAGLDMREGGVLARRGSRVTPALIGLVAAGGHGTIPAARRPRVAILSTGSELVPPGVEPGPDQIVNSNGAMLAALLCKAGAETSDGAIAPDDIDIIAAAIEAARGADILVTIGGASVGDHDLVAPALRQSGASIDFWKVAIRPGKPVLTGMLGDCRVVGLPGNPVSAFVCAQLFLLPLVRALVGDPAPLPRTIRARAGQDLEANGNRRDFQRAVLSWSDDAPVVTPAATQDSSMLSVLAASNALLVRPPLAPAVTTGDWVEAMPLDNGGDAS